MSTLWTSQENSLPEHCEAKIQEVMNLGYDEIAKMLGTIPESGILILTGRQDDGDNPIIVMAVGSGKILSKAIHSVMMQNDFVTDIVLDAVFDQ